MYYSLVDQEFEAKCHAIHPKVDPNVCIKRYNYYKQRMPLFSKISTDIHQKIHDDLPNINTSFIGRLKGKRSYYNKSIVKIAENILTIFPSDKFDPEKRAKAINKFFDFLPQDRFDYIQNLILKFPFSGMSSLESFSFIFEKLTDEEKDELVSKLSKTEDIFAYSVIVNDVNFPVNKIIKMPTGEIGIVTSSNEKENKEKIYPIHTSIQFSPEDIMKKENGMRYLMINGIEEPFIEYNLLYPSSSSASKRTLDNALKTKDGKLTFLQDSFVLKDGSILDIESVEYDENREAFFLTTPTGERYNLSHILETSGLTLKKHDEQTCKVAGYEVENTIRSYYNEKYFNSIPNKRKDYWKNPKPNSKYEAFHDSVHNSKYDYDIEGQIKTLLMQKLYNDETTTIGHDTYKQKKAEEFEKNPILSTISSINPIAFDSSTPTLMQILKDNPDVDILDLMGDYFLTTCFANGTSHTYRPDEKVVFEHLFSHHSAISPHSTDGLPSLDFSSYDNFFASKAALENARKSLKNKSSKFPDFEDDL